MIKTSSISGLKAIMRKYQLFPRKKWGQNFLVDGNILTKIADQASATGVPYAMEIGPGLGALTAELAPRFEGVLSVDIDRNLEPALREVLQDYPQVQLLFADILGIDIEETVNCYYPEATESGFVVCANIPYNITTPIIFKLLEECSAMKGAILMIQREVADRILASPGSKDYGLLTLMTRYRADARLITKVSRNCFYPRPEVDSSVISLMPLSSPRVSVSDEDKFKGLMRTAFQMRRKTMLNICHTYYAIDKTIAQTKLEAAGINPMTRPEQLSLEDFARLAVGFSE
ncbi:MAG: 16S rRNA (adenine(1518)-N(6)/adenine(1519)-N(6))-dimethyltransferase RsmA [Syntrophomonadaceae bacterium]|nr:16S rRNA (adenine(1518)-N(6)/adenine(1519)-N(6))-dimethyltransferase RsmA [Syntrophomonadaceae bacterium]